MTDKKYSVIHFTGYLKSWAPTKDPLEEDSGSDSESCNLSCLVRPDFNKQGAWKDE